MRTFLQVRESGDKATSSLLKSLLRTGVKLLVGVDAFKGAWKNSPDPATAVAMANNTTKEGIAAQLRLNGQSPAAYFAKLDELFGDDISGESAASINAKLAQADSASKDSSQQFLILAGVGLLMMMAFTGKGRGFIKRGYSAARSRFRSFRPKLRFKFRSRRRGRR